MQYIMNIEGLILKKRKNGKPRASGQKENNNI